MRDLESARLISLAACAPSDGKSAAWSGPHPKEGTRSRSKVALQNPANAQGGGLTMNERSFIFLTLCYSPR